MAAQALTTATLTLYDLPGTNYTVIRPILAEVEPDDAGFVVAEQSTGVYHYARDLSEALAGFIRAFAEEFDFLLRNEERLSPSLLAQLERMRSLLKPRQ